MFEATVLMNITNGGKSKTTQEQLLFLGFPETQMHKLLASDGLSNDNFGNSVSISANGNTVVIGSFNANGTNGVAYIFTLSGSVWTEQAKLVASDSYYSNKFGNSVSISADGNTVIIGAPMSTKDYGLPGAAYIFTRSGSIWTEQTKLTASDEIGDNEFGNSVSISADGNTVIIGAPMEIGVFNSLGSAYVFTRSGSVWIEQAKLTASDGRAHDSFGFSTTISGDGNTVVVSGFQRTWHSSKIYIFTRTGSIWTEQANFTASNDSGNVDEFGYSISISTDGNTIAAGATKLDGDSYNLPGYVGVFIRNNSTWTEQTILTASDAVSNNRFGVSVSLSQDGNVLLVGANGDDINGSNLGAAYVFKRNNSSWIEHIKLVPNDGEMNDGFGKSVSILANGSVGVIGSNLNKNENNNLNTGSVYIFS